MERKKIDKDRALHFAFFNAAHNGEVGVLNVLLAAGVNIHEQYDLALRGAAEFGRTEAVRLLLEEGADVHAKGDEAFRLAKANGHEATAALLQQWMGKANPPRPSP